jgi:hypothetical protein
MVTDPDTVFVNLRIDDDLSFVTSQSKKGALSSQGSFSFIAKKRR